jgi:hypothetical protein
MTTQPPVRATDREREETVEVLRAAFAAGCLNESELAERAGRAYAAVTREDLHGLLCDLPGELVTAGPDLPDAASDSDGRPRRLLGWEFGLMLAGAGAWMIVAALHGVVAVPFILLWLVALRAWGWLPRFSRRGQRPGEDGEI